MSALARDSIMGDPERSDAALLSAGILAACAAAIAGWALYRSARSNGRPAAHDAAGAGDPKLLTTRSS
jgi:hypothetical protein